MIEEEKLPEFKKIFGLISNSLFEELKKRDKFSNGWDAWLSSAIIDKLNKEEINNG
jgi:hypothetical protein